MTNVSKLLVLCQVLVEQPVENLNIDNIQELFEHIIKNLKLEMEMKKI